LAFILLSVAQVRAAPQTDPKDADYLLHLPGIGGYRWIDRQMVAGLRQGGYEGRMAVHDWTAEHEGLEALMNRPLHERQARRVADALVKRFRENPKRRIILTAHSGGAGIAVWALEALPDDVQVDTVILLASALSPDYDLTPALRHVRGKMYAFNSLLDTLVLGVGTRTFGTVDGVKCDASGRCGFALPEAADEGQYKKLVQVPYDAAWMALGNVGDHIGPMTAPFSRDILTPIVRGKAVKLVTSPTGRASAQSKESAADDADQADQTPRQNSAPSSSDPRSSAFIRG
jgi:pimeloyl-ACP methyl ester carboxylesterase